MSEPVSDIIGMHAGYPLVVHAPGRCGGEMCCIHNPSAHALSDRPLHWRDDRAIMERICVHGVGHPDPDDAAWRKRSGRDHGGWDNVHGCDGCCTSPPPLPEFMRVESSDQGSDCRWMCVMCGRHGDWTPHRRDAHNQADGHARYKHGVDSG